MDSNWNQEGMERSRKEKKETKLPLQCPLEAHRPWLLASWPWRFRTWHWQSSPPLPYHPPQPGRS